MLTALIFYGCWLVLILAAFLFKLYDLVFILPELVFIKTMQETAVVPTESTFLRVDSKVNSFLGYTAVFMKKG